MRGVLIVLLRDTGGLDHYIFINADREHIHDSRDDYPMRLPEEALFICDGEEVTNFYVSDVREIFCTSI